MPKTRSLNARLSEPATKGLDAFALAYGVTVTGLIEALGCEFAEHVPSPDEMADSALLSGLVDHARQIDLDRRSRRRR